MADLQLGNISTSLVLDLSGLTSAVQQATGSFNQLEQNIKVSVGSITQNVKVMGDNMGAQQQRLQASLSQISSTFGLMGGALGVAIGGAVKEGADLDTALMTIANNTSLTNKEVGQMTETVKRLGKETGASFTQLATGFAKITNMGYSAAQAPHILEVAMKAALATGTDVGQTAQILAQTMKLFGFSTGQASGAMNVLVQASKDGNTTLQQFVGAAGPTLALAGSMNTSLTSVAAAFVTLTRAGFSASEAGTQIKNVLVHLAEPGTAVRKMLEDLSQRSKIDLVSAFTISAQAGKGMGETLEKVRDVAHKLGLNAEDLEMKLIHAMRGGLGAMVLSKAGAADYNEEVKKLDATLSGNLDPTTAQFQQQQQSLNAQLAKGRNEMQLMALSVEHALQPAIVSSLQTIRGLIEGFLHLSESQQKGIVTTAALISGLLVAAATITRVIATVNALTTALAALGIASAGPVALGLLAAAAAAGLLYVAYNKLTESTAKSYEETLKDAEAQKVDADQKAKNSSETMTLMERYDKLKSQTRLTAAEQKELRDILDQVSKLSPNLVTGFDNQGHALGFVSDAARTAAQSYYELHRAAALAASAIVGVQAQEKAQQRDRLNDELTRQRLLLQNKAVDSGFNRRVTGAEANNPLATDVHRNPFTGEMAGYSSVRSATPAEQAATASTVRSIESQMAALVRDREGLMKQMGVIQAPFAPGHQGAHPADDLRRKELAAKNAEIDRLKAEKDRVTHDAGLPNYSAPAKEKKGRKGKKDDDDAAEEALKDARNKIFDLTHTDAQSRIREAQQQYRDRLEKDDAKAHEPTYRKERELTIGKINTEAAKEAKEKVDQISEALFKLKNSEDMVSRMDFLKEFRENFKIDPKQATNLLIAQMDKLNTNIQKREAETEAEQDKVRTKQLAANEAAWSKASQTFKQEEENKFDYERETGLLSLQSVRDVLAKKLQGVRQYTEEWMRLMRDLLGVNKEIADKSAQDVRTKAALEDERMRYEFDSHGISLQAYKQYLTSKLQAAQVWSAEYIRILEQINAIDKGAKPTQHQEIAANWKAQLQTMRANLSGILGGAFQDLFDGKSHQLFDRMLQNFVKMLEQMAAKALAMGIINLLTGGAGGFLGGAANGNKGGGFLGSFGFDDASNDKKAQHWGFDFGRYFTGGMADYNNAHKPLAGMGSHQSSGDVHIHNNFHGMVVREEADIDRISDQIARKVQTGLRNFVGTGR